MNKTITISYEWFDDNREISEDHKRHLRDYADEHIKEMIEQGYGSGELLAEIEDEDYRGWWNMSEGGE